MQTKGTELKHIEVIRIIFSSDDDSYSIFEGVIANKAYVFKGAVGSICVGSFYDGVGRLLDSERGPFYQLEYVVPYVPTEQDEISIYLEKLKVPGVGRKTCQKLAEMFGASLFDIIDTDEFDDAKIRGLTGQKKIDLKDKLADTISTRRDQLFVISIGLGMKLGAKIIDHYGASMIVKVTENPYRLMFDIEGIAFEKADSVGRRLGFPNDHPLRLRSLIFHQLQISSRSSGSTKFLIDDFINSCLLLIKNSSEPVSLKEILWSLYQDDVIKIFSVDRKVYVALTVDYNNEKGICKHVRRLSDDLSVVRTRIDIDKYLKHKESVGQKVDFTLSQRSALDVILFNNLSILIGPPGTGKTFTVKALIEILVFFEFTQKSRVGLCAPTAIAAKILEAASGVEALTLHRMLKFQPDTVDFAYDEYNRLEQFDLLIIDECSMVDVNMAHCMLKAVSNKTQVVLLGDDGQLGSVDKGAFLRDLINIAEFPVMSLKEGKRFSERSDIGICASDIRHGNPPSVVNQLEGSFFFKRAQNFMDIRNDLADYIFKICDKFSVSLDQVQVLTPKVVGELGSTALSLFLKKVFNPNPSGLTLQRNDVFFNEGDRVLLTQNLYQKGVFNGDIGYITNCFLKPARVVVDFGRQCVEFELAEIDHLTLAYAISVHKSQGSQFPVVVMPFHHSFGQMLYRSIVLTGITRAQLAFVGIGDFSALTLAASVDITNKRQTLLPNFFRGNIFRIDDKGQLYN